VVLSGVNRFTSASLMTRNRGATLAVSISSFAIAGASIAKEVVARSQISYASLTTAVLNDFPNIFDVLQ